MFQSLLIWQLMFSNIKTTSRRSDISNVIFTDLICRNESLTIRPYYGGRIFICDILYSPLCAYVLNPEFESIITTHIPLWLQDCQLSRECLKSNITNFGNIHQAFSIRYAVIPERGLSTDPVFDICNNETIIKDKSGYIRSPYYPSTYANNLKCTTKINIPSGHRLLLYADDFQLEGRGMLGIFNRKPNDFVQINDRPLLSGELSGKILFDSFTTNNSITFKSDYANTWRNYRGFSIRFLVISPKNEDWNSWINELSSMKVNGLALQAVSNQDVPVEYNRKYVFIGFIMFFSIVSLLGALCAYNKHRRTMKEVKQALRKTVDELVQYVNVNNTNNRPINVIHHPSTTDALLLNQIITDSNGNKQTDKRESSYDYVMVINGSDIQGQSKKLLEDPPSYEDIDKKH